MATRPARARGALSTPALPGLAIATVPMVATRCTPALPGLAIATSGNLDFSSCVYLGKDLATKADD